MNDNVRELKIQDYKGFYHEQTLRFAIPNGKQGSGLTVVVGQNNAGKSTILEVFRKFRRDAQVEDSEIHPGKQMIFQLVNSQGEIKKAYNKDDGSMIYFDHLEQYPKTEKIIPISSRRYWPSSFAASEIGDDSYRGTLHTLDKNSSDGDLGRKLININKDFEKKKELNRFIKRIIPNFTTWTIGLSKGQNYIKYTTNGGSVHNSELFGDGIISIFKIFSCIIDFKKGDILIIDEPELSLHPQAQKELAKILAESSIDKQIVVITHSTTMIHWEWIINGCEINRINKVQDKFCEIKIIDRSKKYFDIIEGYDEWQKPQLLDSVSKEIFFSNKILFVEGQEDVGLIRKFSLDWRNSIKLISWSPEVN